MLTIDVMTDQRRPRPFHERFSIEVGADEARLQFVHRISNNVFNDLLYEELDSSNVTNIVRVHRDVMDTLGTRREHYGIHDFTRIYVGFDFLRFLRMLEALYRSLQGTGFDEILSERINRAISASDVDLGISWQPPIFVPTGAKLLDDCLVNDPLHWLDEPQYKSVYDPFQNGLSHFLEGERKPQLLKTVIRDMYEAVEALAKIVTGRPNEDLSANRQLFVKNIKASKSYKKLIDQLLKDYIAYASDFRHAEDRPGARAVPSRDEVESFMYLTGLFIRLAVERSD